ncbi:FAD-dependent oxidoreductase [soil metagenome]
MPLYDVAIIGGGLAGLSAALELSDSRSVVVFDSGDVNAGSRAAAGLANPMPARRAALAWRAGEALDCLEGLLEKAGATEIPHRTGVLRPAVSDNQGSDFQHAALNHPEHAEWHSPYEASSAYPHVHAPHGALFVRSGLAVDLEALCEALHRAAATRGVVYRSDRVVSVRASSGGVETTTTTARVRARHAILACGASFGEFAVLDPLALHRVKGVVLKAPRPESFPPDSPSIAGHGYIANLGTNVALGTTFSHPPFDNHVLPEETAGIARRCNSLLKDHTFEDVIPRWGVRVTRHGSRRPVLGPVSSSGKVWFFGALGAKGLLTAPLLAAQLPVWLEQPGAVWPDLRPDSVRQTA